MQQDDVAVRDGRIKRGELLVFAALGAGKQPADDATFGRLRSAVLISVQASASVRRV